MTIEKFKKTTAEKPSRGEAEAAVEVLLRWAGDNPEREGLRDGAGRDSPSGEGRTGEEGPPSRRDPGVPLQSVQRQSALHELPVRVMQPKPADVDLPVVAPRPPRVAS